VYGLCVVRFVDERTICPFVRPLDEESETLLYAHVVIANVGSYSPVVVCPIVNVTEITGLSGMKAAVSIASMIMNMIGTAIAGPVVLGNRQNLSI
jgi:hypothetical protein